MKKHIKIIIKRKSSGDATGDTKSSTDLHHTTKFQLFFGLFVVVFVKSEAGYNGSYHSLSIGKTKTRIELFD